MLSRMDEWPTLAHDAHCTTIGQCMAYAKCEATNNRLSMNGSHFISISHSKWVFVFGFIFTSWNLKFSVEAAATQRIVPPARCRPRNFFNLFDVKNVIVSLTSARTMSSLHLALSTIYILLQHRTSSTHWNLRIHSTECLLRLFICIEYWMPMNDDTHWDWIQFLQRETQIWYCRFLKAKNGYFAREFNQCGSPSCNLIFIFVSLFIDFLWMSANTYTRTRTHQALGRI